MAMTHHSNHQKQNFTKYLSTISFSSKTIPVALIAVCVLAFGLLIPFLGLYLDDWHHVYFGFNRGLHGLQEFFLFDGRPYAYLFYSIGFKLLGYSALHWQVLALGLRTLTVILIWLCFREIWPEHEREVAWVAILFAIYPLFNQQQLSIAYSLHWFGYSLYAISIWTMVLSIKRPARYWIFTSISLATCFLHLFFLEYFVGLELIRPVIIWLLLSREEPSLPARLRKTFLRWLPYLLLLVAYVFFRLYFLPKPKPGYERNKLVILYDLIKAPLHTSFLFVQHVLQDTFAILISSWNNAFNTGLFAITQPTNLRILVIVILAAAGLFFYLIRLRVKSREDSQGANPWYKHALILGILLTLLGILPIWLTDQFITTDNPLFSSRYSLAALIGASLVIVAILEVLIASQRLRTIVFCALVGASIGWQLSTANEYRLSWNKQSQFFNQLYWRAPYIEPGTTILSDGEIFSKMTEIETSFAISTLYPKNNDAFALDYWFFSLSRRFSDKMADLVKGIPVWYNKFYTVFNGNSKDSLIIYFEPDNNQCLWILGPGDQEIPLLPDITRQALPVSNLARIKIDSPLSRPIPRQIFGADPGRPWCYYYEKADLARQYKDWDTAIALWNEAATKGLTPGNGVEYLPFIEGFANIGDWIRAEELTFKSEKLTRGFSNRLCVTWNSIESATPPSQERDDLLKQIRGKLACP
jgi:hypothetical protein